MNYIITALLILILLNQSLVIIKLFDLHIVINKKANNTKEEFIDPYQEEILGKKNLYNVERFRNRMKKIREENNKDEDGLFDIEYEPTPEDLGYFTGSEISE